eukprot:scaffold23516_cov72-Skeletonema_dohrnii-CCMP3373.AAC.1
MRILLTPPRLKRMKSVRGVWRFMDYSMAEVNALPDPCPVVDKDKEQKTLVNKDTKLYAPLSNVGAVQFDKDAVYIDIGRANYTKKENLDLPKKEGENEDDGSEGESSSSSEEEDIDMDNPSGLLKSLQDVKEGVDQKMKYSSLRLFKGSKAVKASEDDDEDGQATDKDQKRRPVDDAFELANSFRRRFDGGDVEPENAGSDSDSSDDDSSDDDDDSASDDDSRNSDSEEEDEEGEAGYSDDESGSDSEDEEMEEEEEEKQTWKTNIAQQAAKNYLRRDRSITNLQQLVYGESTLTNSNLVSDEEENDLGNDDDEGSDDEFFTLRNKSKQTSSDSSRGEAGQSVINDIQLGEMDSSRKMPSGAPGIAFGVDAWLEEGENCLIESIRDKFVTGNWGGNGDGEEGGEEEFDDFEDLEAGEKYGPNGEVLEDSDDDEDEATAGMSDAQLREFNAKKKAAQKTGFDDDYDESKKGN